MRPARTSPPPTGSAPSGSVSAYTISVESAGRAASPAASHVVTDTSVGEFLRSVGRLAGDRLVLPDVRDRAEVGRVRLSGVEGDHRDARVNRRLQRLAQGVRVGSRDGYAVDLVGDGGVDELCLLLRVVRRLAVLDLHSEVLAGQLELATQVVADIRAEGRACVRVHLKVRVAPFFTSTKVRKLPEPTYDAAVIAATAHELYLALDDDRPVRLLGIRGEMVPPEGGY